MVYLRVETEQPDPVQNKYWRNQTTARCRTADSTGQDSAVGLHLEDKGHWPEDGNVGEDRWFERGVKESTSVRVEQPDCVLWLFFVWALCHCVCCLLSKYFLIKPKVTGFVCLDLMCELAFVKQMTFSHIAYHNYACVSEWVRERERISRTLLTHTSSNRVVPGKQSQWHESKL